MERLEKKTEDDLKKRRFRIGIICIVVGLLGMLITGITEEERENQPTEPATTAVTQSAEGK